MNADTFLQELQQAFAKHPPTGTPPPGGNKPNWTDKMTGLLKEIGEKAKYIVHCRNLPGCEAGWGEFRRLDVVYLPDKREGPQEYVWFPPCVVIQHENEPDFGHQFDDFYKACLYAVPLRVFIGYTKNRDGAGSLQDHADRLTDSYNKYVFRQATGGETLIMLGWGNSTTEDMAWEVRVLRDPECIWRPRSFPMP